ncbi:hypothetical protein [Paraburkholderia silvatlantica]|uniref:hypothetical protein n=1 Tax=Paraburkholderia silvatlantica TaxID=321895 RepID=UPI00105CD829|nr:hypothetical protein [Paraburkholderia silvatlantica]
MVDASLAMAGISGWKRWLSGVGVWFVKGEVLNRAIAAVQKDLQTRSLPTEPSTPYITKPLPTDNDLYPGA